MWCGWPWLSSTDSFPREAAGGSRHQGAAQLDKRNPSPFLWDGVTAGGGWGGGALCLPRVSPMLLRTEQMPGCISHLQNSPVQTQGEATWNPAAQEV
jgi:hypothetical protein